MIGSSQVLSSFMLAFNSGNAEIISLCLLDALDFTL